MSEAEQLQFDWILKEDGFASLEDGEREAGGGRGGPLYAIRRYPMIPIYDKSSIVPNAFPPTIHSHVSLARLANPFPISPVRPQIPPHRGPMIWNLLPQRSTTGNQHTELIPAKSLPSAYPSGFHPRQQQRPTSICSSQIESEPCHQFEFPAPPNGLRGN